MMAKIKMIVAMGENRVIGKDGEIPWHYPEDLQHFKEQTMGSTIIMGRKTFESPGLLPGREIIVLTRSEEYPDKDVKVARDKDDALEKATNDEVWICGGQGVYDQFMDIADKIFVSEIPEEPDGDTYFPEISNRYGKYDEEEKETFTLKKYSKLAVPDRYIRA